MREKILECLGTFPKKTKLNLIELGSIDKESYIQKLIEYNVEEDERVKSYLLLRTRVYITMAIIGRIQIFIMATLMPALVLIRIAAVIAHAIKNMIER